MRTSLLWVALVVAPGLCGAAWAQAPADGRDKILVLGDSLSAGYGIASAQGWVTLLQQKLAAEGYPYQVVNASVSGDTTAGGLARLPAALRAHQPRLVLLELGGNDGLRGLPVSKMRDNLKAMARTCREAGAQVLLLEMRIPDNYGADYTAPFQHAYAEVAQQEHVPLVPFFLAAIATDRGRWFQEDGIHPIGAAQPQMLDAVWPRLEKLLKKKS